jgi:hypothetical protein
MTVHSTALVYGISHTNQRPDPEKSKLEAIVTTSKLWTNSLRRKDFDSLLVL